MFNPKEFGVENFTIFNNMGYIGLYNIYNFQLAKQRGVQSKDLIEYMGLLN